MITWVERSGYFIKHNYQAGQSSTLNIHHPGLIYNLFQSMNDFIKPIKLGT